MAGSRRRPTPPRRSSSSSTTSPTSGPRRTPKCTRQPGTYAELRAQDIEYATGNQGRRPRGARHRAGELRLGGYVNLQSATALGKDGNFLTGGWTDEGRRADRPASASSTTSTCTGTRRQPAAAPASPRRDGRRREVAAREQAPRSLWDPTTSRQLDHPGQHGGGQSTLSRARRRRSGRHTRGRTWFSRVELRRRHRHQRRHRVGRRPRHLRLVRRLHGHDVAAQRRRGTSRTPPSTCYRNYDGNGAGLRRHVGGGHDDRRARLVGLREPPVRRPPSKLVIVAINKATTSKVAGIRIEHSTVYTNASVYTITAAGAPCPSAAAGITSVGDERVPRTRCPRSRSA